MSVLNIYIDDFIGVDYENNVKGVTLEAVVRQVSKHKEDYDTIKVNLIDTPGGDVEQGQQISKYLKSTGKTIHTHAVGLVASISSIIHACGDIRTQDKNASLMIHNPYFSNVGAADASTLEALARDIKETENELAQVYVSVTGQPLDVILDLMKNETYIDSETAFDLGFTTQNETQELKPVAFINKNNMNESKKSFKDKFFELFASEFKEEASSPVALDVNTASGDVLVFTKEEGDIVEGDEATVNGQKAEGSYIIKDGAQKVTFVEGKVSQLEDIETEAPEEGGEDGISAEALAAIVLEAVKPLREELASTKEALASLSEKQETYSKTMSAVRKLVGEEVKTDTLAVSSKQENKKEEKKIIKFFN